MDMNNRTFSIIANHSAKQHLSGLLTSKSNPESYCAHMVELGRLLANEFVTYLDKSATCLIISTAEDADFLQKGVTSVLHGHNIDTKLAVFWNHHYQLSNKTSVAPIVHKFIEAGFESTNDIVIVKSVMSGSCVVRTNLIEMIEQVKNVNNIYIVSPVIHSKSEESLSNEFPSTISDKFKFVYFAKDMLKDQLSGEVIPGIGGEVYNLLGLSKQPVLTSYIPNVVQDLVFGR